MGATQPWLSLCALSTATRQWSLGGLTFGGGASGTSVAFRAEGAGTVHLAGHVTGAAAALASPGENPRRTPPLARWCNHPRWPSPASPRKRREAVLEKKGGVQLGQRECERRGTAEAVGCDDNTRLRKGPRGPGPAFVPRCSGLGNLPETNPPGSMRGPCPFRAGHAPPSEPRQHAAPSFFFFFFLPFFSPACDTARLAQGPTPSNRGVTPIVLSAGAATPATVPAAAPRAAPTAAAAAAPTSSKKRPRVRLPTLPAATMPSALAGGGFPQCRRARVAPSDQTTTIAVYPSTNNRD